MLLLVLSWIWAIGPLTPDTASATPSPDGGKSTLEVQGDIAVLPEPADDLGGNYRGLSFDITGVQRDVRGFLLTATETSTIGPVSVIDPYDASRMFANFGQIVWVVRNAFDQRGGTPEDVEYMAEQAAVWFLSGVIPSPDVISDASVRSRVDEILSDVEDVRSEAPRLSAAYQLQGANGVDSGLAAFRVTPRVAQGEIPSPASALLTVSRDGRDLYALTSGPDGAFDPIALDEGAGGESTYHLETSFPVPAGVVFGDDATAMITAQYLDVSFGTDILVPPADALPKLKSLYGGAVAVSLTQRGEVIRIVVLITLGAWLLCWLAWLLRDRVHEVPVRWLLRIGILLTVSLLVVLAGAGVALSPLMARSAAPPDPSIVSESDLPVDTGDAAATSCYPPGPAPYSAARLVDGDIHTSWVSRPNQGVGSMLAFDFGKMVNISEIVIDNGFQSSSDRATDGFGSNGRAVELQLISDGGWSQRQLKIDESLRETTIPLVRNMRTTRLVIRVTGVSEGFLNVAISEIRFRGQVDSSASPVEGATPGLPAADEVVSRMSEDPNCPID